MHFIHVNYNTEEEAKAFLDGLYYSDSVASIGVRNRHLWAPGSPKVWTAVAVNCDANQQNNLDIEIDEMLEDNAELDVAGAYFKKFPDTVDYQPENF